MTNRDLRSAEAKARDAWLESPEGTAMRRGLAEGQFLENRLKAAFAAGLDAGMRIAAERLKAEALRVMKGEPAP